MVSDVYGSVVAVMVVDDDMWAVPVAYGYVAPYAHAVAYRHFLGAHYRQPHVCRPLPYGQLAAVDNLDIRSVAQVIGAVAIARERPAVYFERRAGFHAQAGWHAHPPYWVVAVKQRRAYHYPCRGMDVEHRAGHGVYHVSSPPVARCVLPAVEP